MLLLLVLTSARRNIPQAFNSRETPYAEPDNSLYDDLARNLPSILLMTTGRVHRVRSAITGREVAT